MINENTLLASKFAKQFNKNYGVITYSGTLAIEIALSSLKLKKHDNVLVLSEVCYSIVNTILKLNLTPIIVTSKNGLYLIDEDIENILKHKRIDCILLVHQYGILNTINLRKYKEKGIKIIEDVAQAWGIGSDNYIIGKYSDIVITSFGKTKPLSYGVGGGLFFDDKSIFEKIDFYDNSSREKESILYSYTYPLCECKKIDYNYLKKLADKIIEEQINNAYKYYNLLRTQDIIKCILWNNKIKNVWHRFPIWVDDYNLYCKLICELEHTELDYQLPHEINLTQLKRNKNCIKYYNSKNQKNIILLRTRDVNIDKQLMILKEIIKKY